MPQHALGGHYGAVVDLAWGGDGGCLQSVSTDQTARLFTGIAGHWFEMARTQVGVLRCAFCGCGDTAGAGYDDDHMHCACIAVYDWEGGMYRRVVGSQLQRGLQHAARAQLNIKR